MSEDTAYYARAAALLRARTDRITGRGADAEHILRVADVFGSEIRTAYRQFLAEFGWGGAQDLELFGTGADVPQFLDVASAMVLERTEFSPPLPLDLLPVLNDGGGNLYCLARPSNESDDWPVVFWDHELGVNQVPQIVASSFGSWLLSRLEQLE